MHTILDILKRAGGWHHGLYVTIDNPPYPSLIIDAMDESGPCGLPALSIAHYVRALAAPEMCLELSFAGGVHLNPFYYRNDYRGSEEWSRCIDKGHYRYDPVLHHRHETLALLWDFELTSHGFIKAFARQQLNHA
jgi:hypothetical protein